MLRKLNHTYNVTKQPPFYFPFFFIFKIFDNQTSNLNRFTIFYFALKAPFRAYWCIQMTKLETCTFHPHCLLPLEEIVVNAGVNIKKKINFSNVSITVVLVSRSRVLVLVK